MKKDCVVFYIFQISRLELPKNVSEDYQVCQNEVLNIDVTCWNLPVNVIFTDSVLQRYNLAIKMGRIAAITNWDELSLFWNLGRIVAWDESWLGTNRRLGQIVASRPNSVKIRKKFDKPTFGFSLTRVHVARMTSFRLQAVLFPLLLLILDCVHQHRLSGLGSHFIASSSLLEIVFSRHFMK